MFGVWHWEAPVVGARWSIVTQVFGFMFADNYNFESEWASENSFVAIMFQTKSVNTEPWQ